MKEDVSFNPGYVTLAGAAGIVFDLYSVSDLVKELLEPLFRIRSIHRDQLTSYYV
jgi:hypothetical protein